MRANSTWIVDAELQHFFVFERDVSYARGKHPLNVKVVFCVLKGLPADTDLITPVVPRGKWRHRCSYTSLEQCVLANSPR